MDRPEDAEDAGGVVVVELVAGVAGAGVAGVGVEGIAVAGTVASEPMSSSTTVAFANGSGGVELGLAGGATECLSVTTGTLSRTLFPAVDVGVCTECFRSAGRGARG